MFFHKHYEFILFDTSEEDSEFWRFLNPVVDSDNEGGNIFEPERSFSDVFHTFVNQQFVKGYKSVFKFAFSFSAFPEIPKMLETHKHKKFIFQH